MPLEKSYFIDSLADLCRLSPGNIALPESLDPRVITASYQVLKENLAKQVALFGSKDEILGLAKRENIALTEVEDRILWVCDAFPQLAQETKHDYTIYLNKKNRSPHSAEVEQWGASLINQAAFLVGQGKLDAGLAGCKTATAEVIRASLMHIGLAEGQKTLSSSFVMIREEGALPPARYLFADCGVVIDPSSEQLVDIAISTARTYQQLFPKEEPKLSFLSFSTKGSARHPLQDKVATACQLFKARYPNILADGELQFDAAFSKEIGEKKSPGSPVAGSTNCFIFPNLDAGNIAYKLAQRLAFFDAYGPVLQGNRRPFNDLSRGASAGDIKAAAMITMLQGRD